MKLKYSTLSDACGIRFRNLLLAERLVETCAG